MVIVNVTQEDIDIGQRNCQFGCPVAFAMTRAGIQGPMVGIRSFTFMRGARERSAPLPSEATRFILNFDSKGAVQPFSFEVDIP